MLGFALVQGALALLFIVASLRVSAAKQLLPSKPHWTD
jgi:hypothetical protein